jgi:hypothetical protein
MFMDQWCVPFDDTPLGVYYIISSYAVFNIETDEALVLKWGKAKETVNSVCIL